MYIFSPGEYIGGCFLVNDVKKGGLGIVYLCYDESLKSHIALKTFQFKSGKEWKIALDNFIHEAKIWSTIEKSYNVVEAYYIYTLRTDDGVIPYIVMEAVEGHPDIGVTLSEWIHSSALDMKLIFLFAREIASGMVQVNKCLSKGNYNFVHRDLKPNNILISKDGSVKITDFGLAKTIQDNISELISLSGSSLSTDSQYSFGLTKSVCGTSPYMSPEQCKGLESIDHRVV